MRLNIYSATHVSRQGTKEVKLKGEKEREMARLSRSWRGMSLNVWLSREVHGAKEAYVNAC